MVDATAVAVGLASSSHKPASGMASSVPSSAGVAARSTWRGRPRAWARVARPPVHRGSADHLRSPRALSTRAGSGLLGAEGDRAERLLDRADGPDVVHRV